MSTVERHCLNNGVLYQGHVLDALAQIPEQSVHCVVTSPPYWGLRDYDLPAVIWGHIPDCHHDFEPTLEPGRKIRSKRSESRSPPCGNGGRRQPGTCRRCGAWQGSLGLEPTPDLYVAHILETFRAVHRILRDDGTLWLNLGDCYIGGGRGGIGDKSTLQGVGFALKQKNLVGIPWRVALAMQADGWILRSDIIWAKPNPRPESVQDRPTLAHEHLFLFSKQGKYYYDAEAIKEAVRQNASFSRAIAGIVNARNCRSVWNINIENNRCSDAHFATFPSELPRRAILAGTSAHGCCGSCLTPYEWPCSCVARDAISATVLDPFMGSGRTARVALDLDRRWIGVEINPDYCQLIAEVVAQQTFSLSPRAAGPSLTEATR